MYIFITCLLIKKKLSKLNALHFLFRLLKNSNSFFSRIIIAVFPTHSRAVHSTFLKKYSTHTSIFSIKCFITKSTLIIAHLCSLYELY